MTRDLITRAASVTARWRSALNAALFAVCAISVIQAQSTTPNTTSSGRIETVEVTESSTDLVESLQAKDALSFGKDRTAALTVHVDAAKKYQQMEGFGASITDSSGWLLFNKLEAAQRHELLVKLFDPVRGIGLNFIRQPMGASDFALEDYSYDDLPAGESDPELKKFSIAHDEAYILPVLKEALAINPHMKVVALNIWRVR